MIRKNNVFKLTQFEPFQEAVTYFSRTGADTYTNYSVSRARRKKVQKRRNGDGLQAVDLVWQITSFYLTVEPKKDDYLTDASAVKWIVTDVTEQFHGNVYNLTTRQGV